jgi:hypothetical protein
VRLGAKGKPSIPDQSTLEPWMQTLLNVTNGLFASLHVMTSVFDPGDLKLRARYPISLKA